MFESKIASKLPRSLNRCGVISALALALLITGCHRHRKTRSLPNTTDYASNLQVLVTQKKLPDLRWPDFSDYQAAVNTFYNDRNGEVAWIRDGKPTGSAKAFVVAFTDAGAKGLNPEDYDASRWADRLLKLAQIAAAHDSSSAAQDAIAQYDAEMTVCVMRYISDLRIGRVNPQHFNFDINVAEKKYDLAEFVSDNAVDADDVPKLIASVEPDSDQYRATEAALAHYLDLARQQAAANAPLLPDVPKSGITPGGSYPATSLLLARLQLEGDAPGAYPYQSASPATAAPATAPGQKPKVAQRLEADAKKLLHRKPAQVSAATAPAPANAPAFNPPELPPTYTADLADAVKSYQHRHGLAEDGKLTLETIKSLNVPLTDRVQQLQASLERWRWLPNEYVNAPLMVNLPEFVLRGYGAGHKVDFTMKVVVGKVVGEHDTPVFAHMMKYLIFRPYWNVPVDIARKELVPHMEKSPGYLGSKNFETTDGKGNAVAATAEQVAHGGVLVREKPGPKNSLGLVKFMFPNQYDIYLHSTPAPELFNRSRRDFSHGCVRVQKPDELAVWVLSHGGDPDWDLAKVQEAMNHGPDNHQVNLKTEIPIVIFYLTAIAGDDGHTHFFDDLYGYDQKLRDVLSKGPPYPVKPDPAAPKPKPGDTA